MAEQTPIYRSSALQEPAAVPAEQAGPSPPPHGVPLDTLAGWIDRRLARLEARFAHFITPNSMKREWKRGHSSY